MNLYQKLKKVANTRKEENKIKLLKEFDSLALRNILKGSLDETIKWDLPSGPPPKYEKKVDENGNPTKTLDNDSHILGQIVDHPVNKKVKRIVKERYFLDLLEGLDEEESKLLIMMKDKKFPFNGIKKETVMKTFPNLIKK